MLEERDPYLKESTRKKTLRNCHQGLQTFSELANSGLDKISRDQNMAASTLLKIIDIYHKTQIGNKEEAPKENEADDSDMLEKAMEASKKLIQFNG